MTVSLIARGHSWIAARLSTWRARRRLADEFGTLGPVEASRMLRDAGLSADQLPDVIRRHPDTNNLLDRLMAALGIDRAALMRHEPETVRDLEVLCTSCRTWRRCSNELARGTAHRNFEAFCPNARELKVIRAVRPN